jgi:hypothetical protein
LRTARASSPQLKTTLDRHAMTDVVPGLWFASFVTLAAICFIGAAYSHRRLRASAGWPPIEGRVIHSATKKNDDGHIFPDVRYQYTVEGISYTSDRVSLGLVYGTNLTSRVARTVLDRYPVGQAVTVFFDPSHPERSCLERSGRELTITMLIVGILFLGLSFLPYIPKDAI